MNWTVLPNKLKLSNLLFKFQSDQDSWAKIENLSVLDQTMTRSQILEPCHKTKLKLLTIFLQTSSKLSWLSRDTAIQSTFPSNSKCNLSKAFFRGKQYFYSQVFTQSDHCFFFFSTSCVRLDVPLPPPERFRRGFVRQTQNIPSLLLCLTILKKLNTASSWVVFIFDLFKKGNSKFGSQQLIMVTFKIALT